MYIFIINNNNINICKHVGKWVLPPAQNINTPYSNSFVSSENYCMCYTYISNIVL